MENQIKAIKESKYAMNVIKPHWSEICAEQTYKHSVEILVFDYINSNEKMLSDTDRMCMNKFLNWLMDRVDR